MATISLCMIVKDEEKWLSQCLESAKLVDEIIIADTGSSDKSIEIAKSFGATVFSIPWEHDFAKARNAAVAKATKEWILVLDADEKIIPDDLKKLKNLLDTISADALKLELRNYIPKQMPGAVKCEPSEITYNARAYKPFKLVRVFRNKGYRYENKVHELVEHNIESAQGKIAEAPIPIHHYGILQSENVQHKMRYYAWLVFKELEENPENIRALYMAGQHEKDQGDLAKSLEYFQKVANKDSSYRNVWSVIASIHLELNDNESAIHSYEKSLVNNPTSFGAAQAMNNLAVLYGNLGRQTDAARLLQIGLQKFPTDQAIKKNAERFGLRRTESSAT